MRRLQVRALGVVAVLGIVWGADSLAQAGASPWRHSLELGVVWAELDGDVVADGEDNPVDGSGLRAGGSVNYRADRGRAAILASVTATPVSGFKRVGNEDFYMEYDADADLTIVEVDYAAPWGRRFEFLAGARFVGCQTSTSVLSFAPREGLSESYQAHRSWVDPVVGVQTKQPLSKALSFWGRADFGGFGFGSQLTWQLVLALDLQVSHGVRVRAGYRSFFAQYEDEEFRDEFMYDARTAGPLLSVVIGT